MKLPHRDNDSPAPELATSSTWLGAVGAVAAILLLSVAWSVWS